MSDIAKGLLQYDLITSAIVVIAFIIVIICIALGRSGKHIIRNMQKRIWGTEDEDEEINS